MRGVLLRSPLVFTLILLLAVVPMPPAEAATTSRCQATTATPCQFVCQRGEILAVSAILGSASGSCGGASASCSGATDCLARPAIVLNDGVGTCQKGTSTQYADCFTLAATMTSSCTTNVAYDACAFACWSGDTIRADAVSSGPGYPRVLSSCGGATPSCQSYGSCSSTSTSPKDGLGICLSRTVGTTITCRDLSPAHQAPSRCAVTDGLCFLDCRADELVGASSYRSGSSTASGFALCADTLVACSSASDCLAAASELTSATTVGICIAPFVGVTSDCFSLPAPSGSSCETGDDYGACAFSCSAVVVASALNTGTVLIAYPRVRASCGGADLVCQDQRACATVGVATRAAPGICLSRTTGTQIVCAGI